MVSAEVAAPTLIFQSDPPASDPPVSGPRPLVALGSAGSWFAGLFVALIAMAVALLAQASKLQQEIQEAERSKDEPRVLELLYQKVEINKQIEKLGAA